MNLNEINGSAPSYISAISIGIPLTLLTILMPLFIGTIFRQVFKVFEYREESTPVGRIVASTLLGSLWFPSSVLFVTKIQSIPFSEAASDDTCKSRGADDFVLATLTLYMVLRMVYHWQTKRSVRLTHCLFLVLAAGAFCCSLLLANPLGCYTTFGFSLLQVYWP